MHVEDEPGLTMLQSWIKNSLKAVLPLETRRWLRLQQTRASERPAYRMIRFGSFRRVEPIHRGFDTARGTFVDRHYMDQFLTRYAKDVKGCVLETGDNTYTRLYGGARVSHCDVLDVRKDHPGANIIADLTNAEQISSNTYDCVILLQTLQLIYDMPAALKTVRRILKPSGVLLATFPGIAQICANEARYCGDYWRLTNMSAQRLFEDVFANVTIETYGNVLAAVAYLHGISAEELREDELDFHDPEYQLLISARAVKCAAEAKVP